MEAFLAAARDGSFEALLAVLDPEVVHRVDAVAAGGLARVTRGAQNVATLALEPLPPVLGNRELVEWVLENLLKNSLDALDGSGEIRVRALAPAPDRVEVRIADTGRGIPPSMRQRIWQPGFTTKKAGWGLGLVLVRRIVEEYHGGRIWVEDNPDRRGICFAIRWPTGAAAPPLR